MSIWDDGSLLDENKETFVLLNRTATTDGYGSFVFSWSDGPSFGGVLLDNQSLNARIAGVQTGQTFGTLKTHRSVELEFHDAFRRVKDGTVYRVSQKDSNQTPPSSEMDIRQYPIEAWEIPR